jgi:hypothetical protein
MKVLWAQVAQDIDTGPQSVCKIFNIVSASDMIDS